MDELDRTAETQERLVTGLVRGQDRHLDTAIRLYREPMQLVTERYRVMGQDRTGQLTFGF